MRVAELKIRNFRGIKEASLCFSKHVVLIGDNNTGKSSVLEALDLVLGPDRLNRRPPVDEHDFYEGRYAECVPPQESAELVNNIAPTGASEVGLTQQAAMADQEALPPESAEADIVTAAVPRILIEATVADLTEEQQARFQDYVEWWDDTKFLLYDAPNIEGVDASAIKPAIRVTFIGCYNPEEDDFEGNTWFTRSLSESDTPVAFRKSDKQKCGFLYLRSLRTGSRALSLEHGSLLDIILRLKEIRPQMWESTLQGLASFDVASDPTLGLTGVLDSINTSLKKYVPREWGAEPHLRVSMLTREHLRKVVTAFLATGKGNHAAPFFRQGTGTINMLVLAMLSQIAEDKQNVIFAMEEPETAIPPYAQKRIVHEVRQLSAQSIFTSHSPYVLEEFGLNQTAILARSDDGKLTQFEIELPDSVKHKRYRQEFRTRFCEGLLARRLLIAEGATEAASLPVAARRLAELDPNKYCSLEALGICTIDAGTDSQISDLAGLYSGLGKRVFAVCDKQSPVSQTKIEAAVECLFMHEEHGFEDLILKNTTKAALERFADKLEWPPHLLTKYPDPKANIEKALSDYFGWSKGDWGVADFLAQCEENEFPKWLRDVCLELKALASETAKAASKPPAATVVDEFEAPLGVTGLEEGAAAPASPDEAGGA